MPLEDEFRESLNSEMREIWSQLRPRGTLDQMNIEVHYLSESKELDIEVWAAKRAAADNVEGRSISVQPTWFPYRLNDVTGEIHYRDGRVALRNISASRGDTRLNLSGLAEAIPDGRWTVNLERITADRVVANRDLILAVPRPLGAALERLNVQGPINLYGSMAFSGHRQFRGNIQSHWDLTAVLSNCSIHIGLPIRSMWGDVRFVGDHSVQGLACLGELNLESLIWQDIQLTNVRGPLLINQDIAVLGSRVPPGNNPPRQITANVFGGSIAGDGQATLGDLPTFELAATLSDSDLRQVAAQFSPSSDNISGRAFGMIELAGNATGRESLRGQGFLRLRDANIYELPVMVQLLKVLSVRPPDATAFTSSDIDFDIVGDYVKLNRIDFNGDAISLKGAGGVSFDHELNVDFYAMVGRDDLYSPLLKTVLHEAGRQFLKIEVDGSLSAPQLTSQPLPALNETLRQLFPEVAARQSAKKKNGGTFRLVPR